MPVAKILDLSTGNMTLNDSRLLGLYDLPDRRERSLIVNRFTDGWTVSTAGFLEPGEKAERIERARKEGFSEAFLGVIEKAVEQDAVMIRFDCDAEYEPGLPVFDWDAEQKAELEAEACRDNPRPRFFCTTFSFRVLSQDRFGDAASLDQIAEATDSGDCVGAFLTSVETELTPKQVADSLYEFGSDPSFFQLDDDGRSVDDDAEMSPRGP